MINKFLIVILLFFPFNLFSQINFFNYKLSLPQSKIVIREIKPKDLKVNNFIFKDIKNTPLKVSVKLGVNTDTFNDFIESEQDNDPSNDGIDFENLTKINFRIFYLQNNISYFIGDKIIFRKDLFYFGIRFSFDLNYDNDDNEEK